MNLFSWSLSAAFTVAIGLASVTTAAPPQLENMAMLTGTCERLIVDGHDFTSGCTSGKIIQSIYSNGRTGWYLPIGDKGALVTLTGISGAKPDANSQIQSVDGLFVNLGIPGVKPTSEHITGSCLYSNPYLGPTSITCTAKNATGATTVLEFRTDGSAPQFMKP